MTEVNLWAGDNGTSTGNTLGMSGSVKYGTDADRADSGSVVYPSPGAEHGAIRTKGDYTTMKANATIKTGDRE